MTNWGIMMADKSDDMLETLFQAAKAGKQLEPDPAFMARVLEDALALQPAPAELTAPPPRISLVARLIGALGGWQPATGMAMAALAGVWIGFSGVTMLPDGLSGLIAPTSEAYLVDFESDFGYDTGEG